MHDLWHDCQHLENMHYYISSSDERPGNPAMDIILLLLTLETKSPIARFFNGRRDVIDATRHSTLRVCSRQAHNYFANNGVVKYRYF